MRWARCGRIQDKAIAAAAVVVAIVRALNQERQRTAFHLVHDVDESVTEGTTDINGPFALEINLVGATIYIFLPEVAHVWASFAQAVADLTENRVLAFVVDTALVLEFECLSPIAVDVWGTTAR